MYESKIEKYGAGGRDPRGSAKKEDDFKWNERRWTGEEDRVEEGVNIIHFPSATDIKDKVRDNSDDNIYQMSPVLSEDNTHGKR